MFPKVSIIIPVYNLENRIEKTLNSILSQSFHDYEIIVVDDCSSDGSAEIVKMFFMRNPTIRHKLLEHDQNKGVSARRNNEIKKVVTIFFCISPLYLVQPYFSCLILGNA